MGLGLSRLTQFNLPSNTSVWAIDLDQFGTNQDTSCLSPTEMQRAQRFSSTQARRHYLTAHIALRQLLAHATGIAAPDLKFSVGMHGKPGLRGVENCFFNLSHSGSQALVGISQGQDATDIGVDVEVLRELEDLENLLPAVLTLAEQKEFSGVSPAQQTAVFLQLWTRKEACLKAWGSGLQLAPNRLELGLSPPSSTIHFRHPSQRPLLVQNAILGDECFGAVAVTTCQSPYDTL